VSIRKRYLKNKPFCTVTFSLSTAGAGSAAVYLVGEFNGWDTLAMPMKKLKNGSFTASLLLERNREYQFRYLLDGGRWENDGEADKYLRNPYGSDNSVIVI